MAGGLFELRRDDITGWWVAMVVDRQFDRARFARPARRVATSGRGLPELPLGARPSTPGSASSSRRRSRSPVASLRRSRETAPAAARRPMRQSAAWGSSATSARGRRSPRPSGHHAPLAEEQRGDRHRDAGPGARPHPEAARAAGRHAVSPGRPELGRAGRRHDEPPLLRRLRPAGHPAPHRRGARRGGALRHPRGHLSRGAGSSRTRSPGATGSSSTTPPASASRPTRHARRSSCGSCRATTRRISGRPPTSS